MLQTSAVFALLLAVPAEDPILEAEASGSGGFKWQFTSKFSADPDGRPANVITDTLANHITATPILYSIGGSVRSVVGKAEAKNGQVIPKVLTSVRTSCRRIREVSDQLTGRSPDEKEDFEYTLNRWGERDEKVRAGAGAKLEAKLFDGDANGRLVVRCVSEVARVPEKGYRYTYIVENKGDRPFKFKWGDYEGSLKPKESFTKTAESVDATFEESATLLITFDRDTEPTAIRTNRWTPPK